MAGLPPHLVHCRAASAGALLLLGHWLAPQAEGFHTHVVPPWAHGGPAVSTRAAPTTGDTADNLTAVGERRRKRERNSGLVEPRAAGVPSVGLAMPFSRGPKGPPVDARGPGHGQKDIEQHVPMFHDLDDTTDAVACMLLGAIAFQMALFYLVNSSKDSIQYYAYHIIGLAISIFTAVMVFDAIHGIVQYNFMSPDSGDGLKVLITMLEVLFWFLVMQACSACFAGAVPWAEQLPATADAPPGEERDRVQNMWLQRKLNIKCWSGMLTHVTGFAAIASWERVQQSDPFSRNFWTAASVVPLGFVCIICMYRLAESVRTWISMYGDGQVTHCEVLWDMVAVEAENDVVTLASSFITVQSLQFACLDVLPDKKGEVTEEMGVEHWGLDFAVLLILAAVMALATFFLFRLAAKIVSSRGGDDMKTRLALIGVNYTSMTFAWSLYFAIKAGLHHYGPGLHPDGIIVKIILALSVSACTFGIIFLLDMLSNLQESGGLTQRAITKIILAKGLLIGFSWEGCFETAFHAISHRAGDWVTCVNLGLSICLCVVVIPAYWKYILPEVEMRLAQFERTGKGRVSLVEDLQATKTRRGTVCVQEPTW